MRIGVAKNKKKIFVHFHKKNIELHPLWLRERVSCKDLLDVNTGQRLYDPSILNHKLKIQNASIKNRNLNISFSDGIKSDYQIGDLLNEINKNLLNNKITLWNSKTKNKPTIVFKKGMFNNKLGLNCLEKFYKYGFVILKRTPCQKNSILMLASLIGTIRPTNFGRLFNVRSVRKAKDLAYTSQALSAHTDNPYRKPIPGIQLLHCIKNDSEGGHSTLTDGFAVSEYLRKKHKQFFKILSTVRIRFTYVDENTMLENWGETIELNKDNTIKRVRLSPRLDYVPVLKKKQLSLFYKARSFFIKLCNSTKFMIKFKLDKGDLMIMDNYRTLHGRTSYKMDVGERHLQGCYIDHDSAESKIRFLKKRFK